MASKRELHRCGQLLNKEGRDWLSKREEGRNWLTEKGEGRYWISNLHIVASANQVT